MNQNFKKYFNEAATRSIAAARVYGSEDFLVEAREAIKCNILVGGKDVAYVGSCSIGLVPKKGDEVYMSEAFNKLKQEFPDLNHVRVTSAFKYISFDTKPKSAIRRVLRGFASAFAI